VRPAVNPGISVSRVGGAAQIKAMKKISGPLRLEYAQYRELASFAQFGSDLDPETLAQLSKGERGVELLKQDQYSPMKVENQVIAIYAIANDYAKDVELDRVKDFEKELLAFMDEKYPEVGKEIKKEGEISEPLEE